MKLTATVLLALVVLALSGLGLQADDKKETKEVILKGTVMCARCALKEKGKCQTVIQVKDGEKTVTYHFDDKGAGEEHHAPVCGGKRKPGAVTGTVSEKNGKTWVKPQKVEYDSK